MPVGAVTSILGGRAQSTAAQEAANKQYEATMEALKLQRQMYDEQKAYQTPWIDSGTRALAGMEDKDFQRDFTMADFQKDPGYDFRMQEGMNALQNSAAARGGIQNGATLKALSRYNQGFASNEYNNAYNRFNADRDRRFGRLSSIAGMGQHSTDMLGGAAQGYANAGSNLWTGLGDSQAASRLAIGNARAGTWSGINKAYERSQDNFFKMGGMAMGMLGGGGGSTTQVPVVMGGNQMAGGPGDNMGMPRQQERYYG